MARTLKGTLIECDPSIKTMILDLDSKMDERSKFVMSELDETHLLIDSQRVQQVQDMLQKIIEVDLFINIRRILILLMLDWLAPIHKVK